MTPVVDVVGRPDTRPERADAVQIREHPTLPEERIRACLARSGAESNGLASIIQEVRPALGTTEVARIDVDHPAVFPDKRIVGRAAGDAVGRVTCLRVPGDLPTIVDELSVALATAEGPEALQKSKLPDKGFSLREVRSDAERACVRRRTGKPAGHLAKIIDPDRASHAGVFRL